MTAGRAVTYSRARQLRRETLRRPVVFRLVLNTAALYLAYSLTLVGNNVLNYARDPWSAAWIPLFPFINGFFWVVYVVQRVLLFLEHHWAPGGLQVLGALLCATEIFRPGTILGLPDAIGQRLSSRFRQGRIRNAGSKKGEIILAILLIVFSIVAWRRFQEGLLTGATLYAAGGVALRVMLPVIILFMLIRRIRIFSRLLCAKSEKGPPTAKR
jgi:hypothetical protein